jgi:phosphinothricin acetyltransferase
VLHHVIESEGIYAKLLAHQCARPAGDMRADEPADGGDAVAMLEGTRRSVLAIVDGIPDEILYRLTTIGHEEYSPLSILQNVASHDRDHYAQIADVLSTARDLRGAKKQPDAEAPHIRNATDADVPRLTEIYNHYIANSPATFDLDPFTVEQRREWFSQHDASGPHRLLFVAESAGVVAGYACTSQFRPRRAYDTTVEVTVYCAPDATGRGIGRALYAHLFEAIAGEDLRLAVAGITVPNPASIALHESFGFRRAGLMHGIGRKFGQYWDVAWYEKELGKPPPSA